MNIRHWLLGSTLFLTGCPYIFGGPDLSNVGDTDVDTDTDDTDDTDNPNAPQLLTFDLELQGVSFVGRFTLVDQDQDFVGGKVLASNEKGDELEFNLPSAPELIAWNPQGVSELALPSSFCDTDPALEWTLQVQDFAGNISNPLTDSLDSTFNLLGEQVDSEESNPVDLGAITTPVLWCAVMENANDEDTYYFEADVDGTFNISFAWDGDGESTDLDFEVYECPPVGTQPCSTDNATFIDGAYTIGGNPEVVSATLKAGSRYRINTTVYAVAAAPATYQVTIAQ